MTAPRDCRYRWGALVLALAFTPGLWGQAGAPQPKNPAEGPRDADRKKSESPGQQPRPVEAEPSRDGDLEARIQEIEEVLWSELSALEQRIQGLKNRLRDEKTFEDRQPGPASKPAPKDSSPGLDPLEKRHQQLLKRQDELASLWKELTRQASKAAPEAKSSKNPADDTKARAKKAKEVEAELRDVLAEILELREQSRERQVIRLRSELDALEEALHTRRSKEERQRAVDSRLKELLDPRGVAGKGKE